MRVELWDLAYGEMKRGARRLWQSPVFATSAILSLGLAASVLVAAFAVIDAVDVRQLPFIRPTELVELRTVHDGSGQCPGCEGAAWRYATFASVRSQLSSFHELAAIARQPRERYEDGADVESVVTARTTPGFLAMLGVAPIIGRSFIAADSLPGARPVALLSFSYWTSHSAHDPHIVGTQISLGDRPGRGAGPRQYTIVGVLPRSFVWHEDGQIFTALISGDSLPMAPRVSVVGRLKPGVSLERAAAEVRLRSGQWTQLLEGDRTPGDRELGGTVVPGVRSLRDAFHATEDAGRGRFALLAAAASILIIALTNVLGLMLVRTQAQRMEFAVRRGLGATRGRIIAQTLAESTWLAVLAGVVAIVGAGPIVRAMSTRLDIAAFGVRPEVDVRALAFSALLAAVVALVLGLMPIVSLLRDELLSSLVRGGDRSSAAGVSRLQQTLVGAEIAVGFTVIVAAALLTKSLLHVERDQLGFDPRGLYAISPLVGPSARVPGAAAAQAPSILSRLGAIPGITSVAAIAPDWSVHLRRGGSATVLSPTVSRTVYDVSPNFFALMGDPIVHGRAFADGDAPGTEPVVIINETAARRLWPGENAVGQRLALSGLGADTITTWTTVVGVARDISLFEEPTADRRATVFRPLAQGKTAGLQILARSDGVQAVMPSLSETARELLGTKPSSSTIVDLNSQVAVSLAPLRFRAATLAGFAAFALFLAAIGLFGVATYAMSMRTKEIGIRVALGAGPGRIALSTGLVCATPTASGLGVGVAASLIAMKGLRSVLYGTQSLDPSVLLFAAIVLAGTAALACALPMWRATRLDPIRALRS